MTAGAPDRSSAPFVLFANAWLSARSGTVVVTRDYALALKRRGWRVAVYSPNIGPPVADELDGEVTLVSDLALLDRAPDIIHGHQHTALIAAVARFPETPAIQVCHDAVSWFDEAVAIDQIRRHVAVDERCRRRVVKDTGLAPESIVMHPNAIDLTRCRPRPPLPRRPGRVLIVAHHTGDHVAAALAACERAGLASATVGHGAGRPTLELEAEMAAADIVIGAARIALEAMAVGCAVLVGDGRGVAGMATSATFEGWRSNNFGGALLTTPPSPEAIGAALAAYDADDAATVSRRVRDCCGLDAAIDRLEALYREVLTEHHTAGPSDPPRRAVQFATYLQRFLVADVEQSPWGEDYARLATDSSRLKGLVGELNRRGFNIAFHDAPPAAGTNAGPSKG